jgi:hypothetical protein
MTPAVPPQDDDMPAEIDFSGGVRGRFHRPEAKLSLPVYLDADVRAYLARVTIQKCTTLITFANDLLKKGIALIKAVK